MTIARDKRTGAPALAARALFLVALALAILYSVT